MLFVPFATGLLYDKYHRAGQHDPDLNMYNITDYKKGELRVDETAELFLSLSLSLSLSLTHTHTHTHTRAYTLHQPILSV